MLEKAFGMDVHRDLLVIAKLGDVKEMRRFGVGIDDLRDAMAWLKADGCLRGVMESTGIYWVPIYTVFREAGFDVCVANAYQVKSIPGRKSDQKDAEWLAYLLRAELIKPSYIPDEKYEEMRSLTRLRTRLVQTQTSFKNRAHKTLQLCNIRIASKLSDLFGLSGTRILDALMSGGNIDEAIEACDKRIRNKKEEIKKSIMGTLSETDVFELKVCLDNIKLLDGQVTQIDERIASKVDKDLVEKLCKLPGIAPPTAAIAIAEIAEASRFEDEKHVAGWTGLAPSRYQTAGKDRKGHITKQGDSWLRRAMVQAAKAASRSTGSELAQFYSRVAGRRGTAIATVALARELLTKVWRIILTGKEYVETKYRKKMTYKLGKGNTGSYDPNQISGILSSASATLGRS